jgi:hypothetical protein
MHTSMDNGDHTSTTGEKAVRRFDWVS